MSPSWNEVAKPCTGRSPGWAATVVSSSARSLAVGVQGLDDVCPGRVSESGTAAQLGLDLA